jgi:fumarylacetoacetase
MRLPAQIGDYMTFCASLHHARNVGRMMRPGEPLPESCRFAPLFAGGRASSVLVSGSPVWRPSGQRQPVRLASPAFGLSSELDFGLAVGFLIGRGTRRGESVPMPRASDQLFGVCLLNAWSARDAQLWESSARGVLFARSFGTSMSPWVVTMEALAPFRAPAPPRSGDDPEPLPYLDSPEDRSAGALDVVLEARLASARMRAAGVPPVRVCRTSVLGLYWTPAQLVTTLAIDGCALRPGDLVSTGTLSGPTADSGGSLLELTWRGSVPVALPGGELRPFLEDGDEVTLVAWCARDGATRIGFGECRGTIVPVASCQESRYS